MPIFVGLLILYKQDCQSDTLLLHCYLQLVYAIVTPCFHCCAILITEGSIETSRAKIRATCIQFY